MFIIKEKRNLYQDITVTSGTTQFSDYYYNDATLTVPSGYTPISAQVIDAGSNRPGFAQLTNLTTVRIYSNYSSIQFKIRVFYGKI